MKMRTFRSLIVAGMLAFSAVPSLAVNPDEMLKDPELEARARDISSGVRCLVCQNESVDASNADLARDLRILIRERLTAGDTDQQVLDFLVSRYGEYVLLRPTFSGKNVILWLLPFLLVVGAGGALLVRVRNKPKANASVLSADEQSRLKQILGDQ
jgi:cytochrome c-type biogenesis protein CcmH